MKSSRRRVRALHSGASLTALSLFALTALANTAAAQDATSSPPAADSKASSTVKEVVVTARRAAIESAIKRKQHADVIVDSVVADDAGKLPDNSITEVLQRVPGVSITHFSAVGDPDHYSVEGSGVTVRGLTGVESTLNGHESFSANGGRGLLWEDVPPELMAAVDVYKSSSADQLEGGIGGAIDLRTHMPFDFSGQQISGAINYNYGTLAKNGNVGGSLMYSNRWDTPIGQIGFLVDGAYSDIDSNTNVMQIEPYYAQQFNGKNVYVPGGFDYRKNDLDRVRTGFYEATQWRPNDSITFWQTGFYSGYRNTRTEFGVYNANGVSEAPASPNGTVFGTNGGLQETDSLVYTGWSPVPCPTGGSTCGFETSDTGISKGFNQTTDFSQGVDWKVTDRLRLKGSVQYVRSTSTTENTDMFGQSIVPDFGINTTHGAPVFTVPGGSALADPANWIWEATQDHYEKHVGSQVAANLDAEFRVSDTGFLRKVKVGARYANRIEDDNVSNYNWQPLSPDWDYNGDPAAQFANCPTSLGNLHCFAAYPKSDYTVMSFPNFFNGSRNVPPAVFPSAALVALNNIGLYHQTFGMAGDNVVNTVYNQGTLTQSKTKTADVYVRADFAMDSFFGIPMNGNIGLRLVNNSNRSNGYIQEPTGVVGWTGACPSPVAGGAYTVPVCNLPGGYFANSGGRDTTNLLPSINIQFLPRPDMHVRLAASQTMTLPSFGNATAAGSISLSQSGLPAGTPMDLSLATASAYIGNPNLKPQVSDNFDVSYEWYLPHNGMVHADAFYKHIRDYMSYGLFKENLPVTLPGGGTQTFATQVTNEFNGPAATIKGFETGVTKFLDFLPHPLDGLGFDANFTYIDSQAPGDLSYDMLGNRIHGLPVDLLSKYNFNVTGMYEMGPLSLRLAYTWRSKYLLTPTANGTNGTYTSNVCTAGCTYNLPVWSAPYGQLDFGATYRFTKQLSFSIEGQNVLNSTTKTLMGAGDQQYGRSWFISDTRYTAAFHFNF